MAYIGRQQDGFGVRSRFIYTATGGQTTFNTDDSGNALSYADGAYVDVYLNGVLLDPADYTATSLTSIVLDSGATASDILEVIVYDVFSVFSGTFTNGITASDATVTGTILAGTDSGDAFNAHSKLRVQKDDHAYLQIKSANTKQAGVLLGDTDDDFVGGMIYDNSTNHLQFNSNDAEAMRIDSSGNVGIGSTVPQGKLTIQKDQAGSSTSGTGTTLTFNGNAGSGNPWEIYRDNGTSGDLVIAQDASGTRSEAMRIKLSNSYVGISTNSPSAPLEVSRSDAGIIQYITNTGSAQAYTAYGNSDNQPWSQDFNTAGGLLVGIDSDETGVVFQGGNKALRFGTNASERMRILAGGGLTFNGDTADANALDDYEEGTWTPTIAGMTYEYAGGAYTKIGRRVQCSGFLINCTSGTASSAAAKLAGLPFTVSNTLGSTSLEDGGAFTYFLNLGRSSSFISVAPDDSSTECFLYFTVGASTGYTSLLRTDLDNSSFSARFFFTYIST